MAKKKRYNKSDVLYNDFIMSAIYNEIVLHSVGFVNLEFNSLGLSIEI